MNGSSIVAPSESAAAAPRTRSCSATSRAGRSLISPAERQRHLGQHAAVEHRQLSAADLGQAGDGRGHVGGVGRRRPRSCARRARPSRRSRRGGARSRSRSRGRCGRSRGGARRTAAWATSTPSAPSVSSRRAGREAAALDADREHAGAGRVPEHQRRRVRRRADVHGAAHQLRDGRRGYDAVERPPARGDEPAGLPHPRRLPACRARRSTGRRPGGRARGSRGARSRGSGPGACSRAAARRSRDTPAPTASRAQSLTCPRLEQRVGLAVVGAEGGELGAVADDVGRERLEVLARRALADEDPHPLAALLGRLLELGALVVGLDAGREVGVERPAARRPGCGRRPGASRRPRRARASRDRRRSRPGSS